MNEALLVQTGENKQISVRLDFHDNPVSLSEQDLKKLSGEGR